MMSIRKRGRQLNGPPRPATAVGRVGALARGMARVGVRVAAPPFSALACARLIARLTSARLLVGPARPTARAVFQKLDPVGIVSFVLRRGIGTLPALRAS